MLRLRVSERLLFFILLFKLFLSGEASVMVDLIALFQSIKMSHEAFGGRGWG